MCIYIYLYFNYLRKNTRRKRIDIFTNFSTSTNDIPFHSWGNARTPRASVLHRRAQFSWGDLFRWDLVQPTYLHKHDAPLCFPFSLRAPALHLLEKNERKRGRWRGPPGEGDGRWVAKKGRELRVGNPILRRSPLGISMYRGMGQGRHDDFFLKPAKCQSFQMIPRNGERSRKSLRFSRECPTCTWFPPPLFFPRRLSWRRHKFRLLNGLIWTRNLAGYFWQDRRSIVKWIGSFYFQRFVILTICL